MGALNSKQPIMKEYCKKISTNFSLKALCFSIKDFNK